MATAVREQLDDADVLVMAAAVADFRPRAAELGKIQRGERESLTLELERTEDILATTREAGIYRVAFAAEAGPQLERARSKRRDKGVDLLVFNDILGEGIGIAADENEVTIIGPSREVHVPRTGKATCAAVIVDEIEAGLEGR
jgi:phosphopantothenoylcysteine decarboxylase/phosphopantothenate--cysteine ligase